MVSSWVERKLEDLILDFVPVLGRMEIQAAESVLHKSGPKGLKSYDLEAMGTKEYLIMAIAFVLPFDPLDILDTISTRLNPLSKFETSSADTPQIDPLSTDPTSRKSSDTVRRTRVSNENEGIALEKWVSRLLRLFLIGFFVVGALAVVPTVASAAGIIDDSPVDDYAGLVTDKVDDTFAGESDAVGEAANSVQGAGIIKTVTCVFSGPGCLRQRQVDKKPGAKDVGETYGLKIKNFKVGSGGGIDVSYQDPDSSIPVSFSVSNPMNGIKGIHARDVMYRIKIIDGDRGVENPYCDTGWLHIGTSDVDGDNEGPDGTDDIRRGTSSGTGFIQLNREYIFGSENGEDANLTRDRAAVNPENYAIRYVGNSPLTYRSCEMLQPALGEERKVMLRLRYDYFSGGQVKFRAMSRSYMLDNSIKQKVQPSKAPDTPVQAAINVKSPVTFNVEKGVRQPLPFGIEVFTETDKSGLRYRIQGIDVINSGFTSGVASSCTFKNLNPGQRMELKDSFAKRVVFHQDIEQLDYWYSEGDPPPTMGCTMVLGNGEKPENRKLLNSISRSGETLAYRVRANYTVSKKEPLDNFKVSAASACDQMQCPRLVTLSKNHSSSYNYKSICRGVDASYEGCSVVNGEWGSFTSLEKINHENIDAKIEEGEAAVNLGRFGGRGAAGFEVEKWKKVDPDLDGVVNPSREWSSFSIIGYRTEEGESEVGLLQLSKKQCKKGNYAPGYPEAKIYHWRCGSNTGSGAGQGGSSGGSGGKLK